jgi:long-chain fatty acid transport protein
MPLEVRQMKRFFSVLMVLVVGGLARTAGATNGMRMIGFGPAQEAMGGVGVGTTLDSASMASNPAGIATLDGRIDVGLGWFKPTVDYKATEVSQYPAGGGPGMFVMNNGSGLDSSRGGSPIPAIGAIKPFGDLTVGLGVFAAAGMGVDYAQNLYGGETHSSYLQGRLTPSVAYRVNDLIQLGVSLNGMLAQMGYDVASGMLQQKHDTATALGIGAVVGLKITPIPMLSFGAAYETKSVFQDFSFDIPAHTGMTPTGPQPFAAATDKLTFDQPQMVTVGASLKPLGDLLIVGVDVEWINWSQTNGQNLPKFSSDANLTGSMAFNLNWSNQWVYKVGAQVSPTKDLAIRVGYNYGKSPLDKTRAFENVAFPAVAEHHITGGVAYGLTDSISLALSGMYAPKVEISGANMQEQGLAAYSTSMSQYDVSLGVSYKL